MRIRELMEGGSSGDIAIKLLGDDLEVLRQKADQIAAVVSKVPGAADVRAERVAGLPYLRIRIRRDALAVMVLTPRTCLIPSRHHFHSLLLL
jgi:cobalt-zinc-cadmium resistance protein CzcA